MRMLPTGWEEVELLKYIETVKSGVNYFTGKKKYIDTGSLSTGKIIDFIDVDYNTRPSRANMEVQENDVLFAKMKDTEKVFLIGEQEKNNLYSTGFSILRIQDSNKVFPEYVFYWLRGNNFQNKKNKECTGATQKALNESKLKKFNIFLPPLQIQKKIVAILEKTEATKKSRGQADEQTNQLLQSVFLEMFGNPITNPKGWKTEKLENYISFITSGSRGWARFYSKVGAKFIRVQNLTGHRLNFQDIAFVCPSDNAETKRTKVKPNDLLLSITGVVGLVAIVPENIGNAYVSQHVAIIRLRDGINPYFLTNFLACPTGGQYQINKRQYGQTKPGLGLGDIKAIRILVPPMALQEKFAQIVKKFDVTQEVQKQTKLEINNLFNTIMQKAFTGELIT